MALVRSGGLSVASPRRRTSSFLVHLVLLGVALCFAAPFAWLLLASVDADAGPDARLPDWTAGNFEAVLDWETSIRPIVNSLLLCGGAAVVNMVVAVLAAYPLSRHRLRFKRPFLYTLLFATGLPITAIMVPVYEMFVRLELVDSLPATALFLATATLPFSIWLTKGFMDGVPVSLEEAAWTDGASSFTALRRVVLPLMAPGMAVVAVFTFIGAWGNFLIPFVLLQSPEKEPAAVGLYTFFGQYGTVAYGQLAAFSVLYSLPAVLLYVVVSRRMARGFNLGGGIKG
ncbi:carbohydrate ABC transporter permease [Streptomyces triticirhizae]|uniref:Carbohydrate ABC transporter permease n=1 Tax=Streptomyces triticirhizae TaxID=2483353 RepID=A0A3M2LMH8_9ACTN|nr:carbohydrate ABC transporter permease [Streptomyces triticirhizae]RMI38326.1 carbohydrate ABC transporter permease [Streptomyces triticirhizae]